MSLQSINVTNCFVKGDIGHNNLYKHKSLITLNNNSTFTKFNSGGLFASGIGIQSNASISLFIGQCNLRSKYIGLNTKELSSKKISSKLLTNTPDCGGLLAGHICGTNTNITITNCYTKGTIGLNCGGLIGPLNILSGYSGPIGYYDSTLIKCNINTSYTSGKVKGGYSLVNSNSNSNINININNCYINCCKCSNGLKYIKGKLGKLPKKYWKSHKHKLPTLRRNINISDVLSLPSSFSQVNSNGSSTEAISIPFAPVPFGSS